MKQILRFKWFIATTLIAVTVLLLFIAPNLTEQAEDAGTLQLPEDADSQQAQELLDDSGASDETISIVYDLDQPLDNKTESSISEMIEELKKMDSPVSSVIDPFENEESKDQLVSKDQKTVLVPVTVEGSEEEINQLAATIKQDVLKKEIPAYITGQSIINHDVNESSQKGLERTEIITVVLIFVLLFAVFRSFVTPFIPLLAVGVTYLLSQSIVAFFIKWFDFPVSNYTQIFLVAVLFGIGTDYCILLLSRYKEELTAGHSTVDAIANTYKTAGKTLVISGIAVFIGFLSIGFAEFTIFKSAVGVAVGIAVLLLVLFTLVPFFMAILKKTLFWPSKRSASHKDSKLWKSLGQFSIYRPLWSILVVALITVPFLLLYNGKLSYNTVNEIGSGYDSVKGLHAIEDGFGKGESLPLTIIVKDDEEIVTNELLPYVEDLAAAINKNNNVDKVRTVTRPTGEVVNDFYADNQLAQVADGLEKSTDGIKDTKNGLKEIQNQLSGMSSQVPAGSNTGGLSQAASGLGQINQQLGKINQGLQQTGNVQQAAAQLAQVQQQLGQIQQSISGASTQLESKSSQAGQLKNGLSQLANGVGSAVDGLNKIQNGLTEATDMVSAMGKSSALHDTGVYIPEDTLTNKDFQSSINRYSFAGKKGIKLEVILQNDPYSKEAIDTTKEIKQTVQQQIKNTPLENKTIAYNGISSTNEDLAAISKSDFNRTVTIMVAGLFIVLTLLFRSLIMPVYMIGSLLLTYYTSLSIAELVFVNILGYDGITWAVPFFGFVMLIALGVDYSIFLLDRFNEEATIDIREAMHISMAKMGTVVITAAIILAGTFAAMMPSGVLSLIQIATIVITGLLFYGLIILPLLIPAITVSFGQGVWWPFKKKDSK
ncbi:MMPL family transporter [Halobacillus salinarum]|uniref:MMPL family transporter n=1 Tax=Halobacillus salinarum TaxID=2932257 RepID=A0ABY4EE79_9BACI|nr:MMPL family transporter [Halobacillus salinarum]UOQ42765.1 MMPL family transporter [Halobacillus salinarum]